jgi:hypothetical protein
MDCIRCGQDAGYNRVVVDLVSGDERGGYCRNCEYEEFGQILDKFGQTDGDCALCNRDGHFGLPAFVPEVTVADDRLQSTVECRVRERTPLLCDEHFYEVTDADPARTDRVGVSR